jgi:predicted nucleic acid-binding protein
MPRQDFEPVSEMTDAQIVQRLHSELKDLAAARPVYRTEFDRAKRAGEIKRALRRFGDVV